MELADSEGGEKFAVWMAAGVFALLSIIGAITSKGFLEADPTLDVSGQDAAQKLSVLIYHAFGRHVPPQEIDTTGIDTPVVAYTS